MKRTGKIARLPHQTRRELNRRLLDNEPGDPLLEWLNARPEVQVVLTEQFDGNPITKQNLSEWRTGGFAIWELREEVYGDAQAAEETSDELDAIANGGLVDRLCTVLAGRYASLLVHWDGEVTPAITQKLRALHSLCRDLTTLRRHAQEARQARRAMEPEEPASGVVTARRHMEPHIPKNTSESDPVAPGRTTFPSKSGTNASADVATSGRHPGPGTGKEDGRMKNEELGKRHGTTDQSKAVAPGRTTLTSDIVMSALAELARSGRHPEPAGKPLPGMPNSLLSKALQAAREQNRPGQPVLTVLPDFDEAVRLGQPAISSCRQ
jgi:hypothetical protein